MPKVSKVLSSTALAGAMGLTMISMILGASSDPAAPDACTTLMCLPEENWLCIIEEPYDFRVDECNAVFTEPFSHKCVVVE